jgi:hypothetical protein
MFVGYQPCQLVKNYQCFMDHLHPDHQGYHVTTYPDHLIYTPAESQWGTGEQNQVLVLFGLVSG